MYYVVVLTFFLNLQTLSEGQVILFGNCTDVETMRYFEIERFLGKWYQIERFPSWFEESGDCSYKLIEQCGRRIEFQHIYVKNRIQYVLHINSSYAPGDKAVFSIPENNVDPFGIPLSVITTDYTNYAIMYGCTFNETSNLKLVVAWILSRNTTLQPDLLRKAYQELNLLPSGSLAYLEKVNQDEKSCTHYWSAHVHAEYHNSTVK